MFVYLQSIGTKGTLHPLSTLRNNEPVPQVIETGCKLVLLSLIRKLLDGWLTGYMGGWIGVPCTVIKKSPMTGSKKDGGVKRLQICVFDIDFYLQQVRILHLDVRVENVQLWKSTSSILKNTTFTWSKMTFTWSRTSFTFSMLVRSAWTGSPSLAHKLALAGTPPQPC